jgi:uncharacterized peroxidase-related enzyme
MDAIVVGLDGSPASLDALSWADAIAARTAAKLVAVRAGLPGRGTMAPSLYAQRADRAGQELAAWCARRDLTVAPTSVVVDQDPRTGLVAVATEQGADLLVVGSRGTSGLAGMFLGGVAQHLAQHPALPLAVVPAGAAPATDHVVVGVDGSTGSLAAVRFTAGLAGALGVAVTAVLAQEPFAEWVPADDPRGRRDRRRGRGPRPPPGHGAHPHPRGPSRCDRGRRHPRPRRLRRPPPRPGAPPAPPARRRSHRHRPGTAVVLNVGGSGCTVTATGHWRQRSPADRGEDDPTLRRRGKVPHISVPEELPGIMGLLAFKPETAATVTAFTQQLLRGPSSLSPGEREMIAAAVSHRNECRFCTMSHTAAAEQVTGDRGLVAAAVRDPASAPVGEKMRALLAIAAKVQRSGLDVAAEDVAAARAAGASDEDLHDTVLVAAAFCMFNRYVDGLAATTPADPAAYEAIGRRLATDGYRPPVSP